MTTSSSYLQQDRGPRLSPPPESRRYWILKRLAAEMERSAQSLPKGDVLVDYGSGDKPYEPLFSPRFSRYLTADLDGNTGADLILRPDGSIPMDDESVDCVLSTQVLEHVPDVSLYLREARRVLRPGRHLVLSTHGFWIYHPDPNDLWRWTRQGLVLELERAGFVVQETRSILGLAQVAAQLWQDATITRIPTWTRRLYARNIQRLIRRLESSNPPADSMHDAAVYVITATKPV